MDIEALRKFLLDANGAGYAVGEDKKWIKEKDGSTTIPYKKGDWESHDNFFGGEPYGGRIVVSYKNKPCWIMVYYGWVLEGEKPDPVYGILRNALRLMPEKAPFRGPAKLADGEYTYTNNWSGDIVRYFGEEQIHKGDILIYKANYVGGLVDRQSGI